MSLMEMPNKEQMERIVGEVIRGIAAIRAGSGNGEVTVVLHEYNTYRVAVTDKGRNAHLTTERSIA
mgnify:FL=1